MRYCYPDERPLEPPEDKRKCVYSCAICDGDILEGEDYYDLPELGFCCEECIKGCKRWDAEIDYE